MTQELQQSERLLCHDEDNSGISSAPVQKTEAEAPESTGAGEENTHNLQKKLDELNNALSRVVTKYREVMISANPDIPSEMITGDTVDDIDRSVAVSRQLIKRIREQLEKNRSQEHIPKGAPVRGIPDLSGFSPREKIHFGIKERGSR